VANEDSNNVSVINTKTNKVIATVPVGKEPNGVAVTPNGTKVYVVNSGDNYNTPSTVSVIDTATNKVITNVTVGSHPVAIGKFIGGNTQKDEFSGSKSKVSLSKHKHRKHPNIIQ
jgi:YVTN family beta-propeller protein